MTRALLLMLAFAGLAEAATLLPGGEPDDLLNLQSTFPPALVPDPLDPTLAHAARSQSTTFPGVLPVRVASGQPLEFTGSAYVLPDRATLDCSHASPFANPIVGSLSMDVVRASVRGWLTTSGCDLAVPYAVATGASWDLVYEGGARIFAKSWNRRIPRDGI